MQPGLASQSISTPIYAVAIFQLLFAVILFIVILIEANSKCFRAKSVNAFGLNCEHEIIMNLIENRGSLT
jgi:hypothetical protein